MRKKEDGSVVKFPCEFPIKIMGRADVGLETKIVPVISKYVTRVDDSVFRKTASSQGKYVSITVTITATSQAQLDNIYQELTAIKEVLMVL